jgi:Domain of unknown function (DUF4020)
VSIRLEAMIEKNPNFRRTATSGVDGARGWVPQVSPLTSGEILAKDPDELLDLLAEDTKSAPDELLRELVHAVSESYEWSVRLAKALNSRPNEGVWKALLTGWSYLKLSEDSWRNVLTEVEGQPSLFSFAKYELVRLLETGIKPQPNGIPAGEFQSATRIAIKLWSTFEEIDETPRADAKNWYSRAINHSAGSIAAFWVWLVSVLQSNAGDGWTGIPPEYAREMEKIANGSSYASDLARVVFASHLHFLFRADEQWSARNVIPHFDWSVDPRRALQTWHGYLSGGTWDEKLLQHTFRFYEMAFDFLSSKFGEFSKNFCAHMAGIATFSTINPIGTGWLIHFIHKVDLDDRIAWAWSMWGLLADMKMTAKEDAWRRWIKSYWDKRILGVPIPLDGSEVAQMSAWAPRLGPVFDEVVQRILASPIPTVADSSSYFVSHELEASTIPTDSPESAAKLISHVLRFGLISSFDFSVVEKIMKSIASTRKAKSELLKMCDHLASSGHLGAGQLRVDIENDAY